MSHILSETLNRIRKNRSTRQLTRTQTKKKHNSYKYAFPQQEKPQKLEIQIPNRRKYRQRFNQQKQSQLSDYISNISHNGSSNYVPQLSPTRQAQYQNPISNVKQCNSTPNKIYNYQEFKDFDGVRSQPSPLQKKKAKIQTRLYLLQDRMSPERNELSAGLKNSAKLRKLSQEYNNSIKELKIQDVPNDPAQIPEVQLESNIQNSQDLNNYYQSKLATYQQRNMKLETEIEKRNYTYQQGIKALEMKLQKSQSELMKQTEDDDDKDDRNITDLIGQYEKKIEVLEEQLLDKEVFIKELQDEIKELKRINSNAQEEV